MNFVDAHDFSVGLVLRVLGIAGSTYYGWRKARQQPSRRAREDAGLLVLIDEIRGESEFAATYGSPRVWLQLRRRGVRVSRKRVERIMRAQACPEAGAGGRAAARSRMVFQNYSFHPSTASVTAGRVNAKTPELRPT
jgi:hypothetical protein